MLIDTRTCVVCVVVGRWEGWPLAGGHRLAADAGQGGVHASLGYACTPLIAADRTERLGAVERAGAEAARREERDRAGHRDKWEAVTTSGWRGMDYGGRQEATGGEFRSGEPEREQRGISEGAETLIEHRKH